MLLRSAGFGAGAVLMAAMCLWSFTRFADRPKSWDENTIVAEGSTYFDKPNWFEANAPTPSVPKGFKLDSKLTIHCNLKNNGSTDYRLSKEASIMARGLKTNALVDVKGDDGASLEDEYFIPAGEKVYITINVVVECAASAPSWKECVTTDLKRAKSFVLFDHANRLKITIPLQNVILNSRN